jgi:hypothetical protein
MSVVFVAVATVALMGAVAVGQWIDRQATGIAMQEWRDRW